MTSTLMIAINVGFDDQDNYNSHDGFKGQYSYNSHEYQF